MFYFFFLMIRQPPRSTLSSSSAASDVYKRQGINAEYGELPSRNMSDGPYAQAYRPMEARSLPHVGRRYSIIATSCLAVAFLVTGVAVVSPDWVSFSYQDLSYDVQNSHSILPLISRDASVKLTAGLASAKVCWSNYPSAFETCQGGKLINSKQIQDSGVGCGIDDPSLSCHGCKSGGVDQAIDFLCQISFNYTSWDPSVQPWLDKDSKIDPAANVSLLCDSYGMVVALGKLCNADRLFFRVGYPGFSTLFFIGLDLLFVVSAFIMALLSMRSNHWQLQLDIGCCPLAKGGWILSVLALVFSVAPAANFAMQSAFETGEPQIINNEGNNVEPVVPSSVNTSQGSDVALSFGWGMFVYFPLVQILLGTALFFSRKAWKLHEAQYEHPDYSEVFFPSPDIQMEQRPLVYDVDRRETGSRQPNPPRLLPPPPPQPLPTLEEEEDKNDMNQRRPPREF
eukprot:TRINITY_DN39318_c0_g1_i1.p1 TRINITY_DN39318_c0_g1~~TRINITY_DN39318_c0_g1_i1.p1  ORF type:complete len:454 (+),score=73.76 TRINITY_DN39318_c0_g1_i1:88-1449(+)